VDASSLTEWMPSSASLAAVLRPTPHNASVGRSPITANQSSLVSRPTPCGLPKLVAILACSLLSPMPTEQCSRVASSTAVRTSSANASGSSVSTARNASSQPSTSTGTSSERSVSMTRTDASSYARWSTGRKTASGHLRAAVRSGIPEPTPNARASYDAVDTTPRSVGSPRPPTTTGSPASSGRRSTSTAAMNWSRSTCSTQAREVTPVSPDHDQQDHHDERDHGQRGPRHGSLGSRRGLLQRGVRILPAAQLLGEPVEVRVDLAHVVA